MVAKWETDCFLQSEDKEKEQKDIKDKFGSFAGVYAWLEWAKLYKNKYYHPRKSKTFKPSKGDIVIYDNIFDPGPHDHIGIILSARGSNLVVAEGNVNNISSILCRKINKNTRGYIRLPNNY